MFLWGRITTSCKQITLVLTGRLSPQIGGAPAHTAVVCLMLWKLILVGDVGMDMALATRMRRLWLSCQRCHRFLTAERTCSSEEARLNDKDRNINKILRIMMRQVQWNE